MNAAKFGNYIKENRERLGWTKKKLAQEIGLDQTTLRSYEAGKAIQNRINEYLPIFKETFDTANMTEDEKYRREVGQFISNMRQSVKWNEERLANVLGYSRKTIQNWEKYGVSMTVDVHQIEMKIRDAIKNEINRKRNLQKMQNNSCTT